MYSRVTLLEIDTLRIDMRSAIELFKTEVLPGLQEHEGYEGAAVLVTPEGKAMIITLWETQQAASAAAGFASGELERYMMLFGAAPGREQYEVAFLELPGVAVT